MKKLVSSGIIALSLANASNITPLNVGIGMGYIDNNYKNLILKVEKNTANFNVGAKVAENYLNGYVNTLMFVNDKISLNGEVGFEKYKIKDKNKFQIFVKYSSFLIKNKKIFPKVFLQIGTKSLNGGVGLSYLVKSNINLECEVSTRLLYKKVDNTKNTANSTIYFNFYF